MLRSLEDPQTDHRVTGWCPACHLAWTSTVHAHCAVCCRHFASEAAFDYHRRVNRAGATVCRDPTRLRRFVADGRAWALVAG